MVHVPPVCVPQTDWLSQTNHFLKQIGSFYNGSVLFQTRHIQSLLFLPSLRWIDISCLRPNRFNRIHCVMTTLLIVLTITLYSPFRNVSMCILSFLLISLLLFSPRQSIMNMSQEVRSILYSSRRRMQMNKRVVVLYHRFRPVQFTSRTGNTVQYSADLFRRPLCHQRWQKQLPFDNRPKTGHNHPRGGILLGDNHCTNVNRRGYYMRR